MSSTSGPSMLLYPFSFNKLSNKVMKMYDFKNLIKYPSLCDVVRLNALVSILRQYFYWMKACL